MIIPPVNSPPHTKVMLTYEGQREIKGPTTAPFIKKMLSKLKAWWSDDEAAWCGTFIAGCMEEANEKYHTTLRWPKAWYRALAWSHQQGYGRKLGPQEYRPGAICTKARKGGGHVFSYLWENATHIFGIAGNTGDMVKGAWYAKSEVVSVVWPEGLSWVPGDYRVIVNDGPKGTVPQKED